MRRSQKAWKWAIEWTVKNREGVLTLNRKPWKCEEIRGNDMLEGSFGKSFAKSEEEHQVTETREIPNLLEPADCYQISRNRERIRGRDYADMSWDRINSYHSSGIRKTKISSSSRRTHCAIEADGLWIKDTRAAE
jgi:hypothetical protein